YTRFLGRPRFRITVGGEGGSGARSTAGFPRGGDEERRRLRPEDVRRISAVVGTPVFEARPQGTPRLTGILLIPFLSLQDHLKNGKIPETVHRASGGKDTSKDHPEKDLSELMGRLVKVCECVMRG
ncbi:MAG: hypothetical protein ACP5ID_06935, partial [Conexivisphaera sp.]